MNVTEAKSSLWGPNEKLEEMVSYDENNSRQYSILRSPTLGYAEAAFRGCFVRPWHWLNNHSYKYAHMSGATVWQHLCIFNRSQGWVSALKEQSHRSETQVAIAGGTVVALNITHFTTHRKIQYTFTCSLMCYRAKLPLIRVMPAEDLKAPVKRFYFFHTTHMSALWGSWHP